MNILEWLQHWYNGNCDGDWEHIYGISIGTLDNPGWSVDIDLIDTILEDVEFTKKQVYNNEFDWIHCSVIDNVFKGRGSVNKLQEILEVFQQWTVNNK